MEEIDAGYSDPLSGAFILYTQPSGRPELWNQYLAGARKSYGQHGVENALDFQHMRDGISTALFVVALDGDGRVVGGLRVAGPLRQVGDAAAMLEWGGRPGTKELGRRIGQRLNDGIVEIKAVWVDRDIARHHETAEALARAFVHTLDLLDVRYAFCTAAEHALPRWQTTGGVISTDIPAVAYPDERYRTRVMWWDRERLLESVSAEQISALLRESGQLRRTRPAVAVSTAVA